jgi:hypothetical protein
MVHYRYHHRHKIRHWAPVSDMFLRNAGSFSKDYTALHPGRWTLHSSFTFSRFIFPKSRSLWHGLMNSVTAFQPQFCMDFLIHVFYTSLPPQNNCTKERDGHLPGADEQFCIYLSQNAFFTTHPSKYVVIKSQNIQLKVTILWLSIVFHTPGIPGSNFRS